jgi:hypothetical protein
MQDLGILGSAVAKESDRPPHETVTDLGVFDNEDDQRAYLEFYLPPGYLDTGKWKTVAYRAGYWLHGRRVNKVQIWQREF